MKHSLPVFLLLLLLLAGCSREDRAFVAMLDRADSLLRVNPDSALKLLSPLSHSPSLSSPPLGEVGRGLGKESRMRYQLLLADALNKTDRPMPSDNVMQEVVDYYDRHGNANERMRAHYLLGRVYHDMGESPQALECYQQAAEQADTTKADCDLYTLYAVYGQMADLYHMQYLPDDEMQALRMCEKVAWEDCDTVSALTAYSLQKRPLYLKNDTNRVLEHSYSARNLYLQLGYRKKAAEELFVIVSILLDRGLSAEAGRLMEIIERESGMFDNQNNKIIGGMIYYYDKGRFYQTIGKTDSALLCYRKLLRFHLYEAAYKGMLDFYKEKKIPDSIAKYAELFAKANDDSYLETNMELVSKQTELYNYERNRRLAEQTTYQLEISRNHNIILGFLIVIIGGLLVALASAYRRKQKKNLITINKLSQEYAEAQQLLTAEKNEVEHTLQDRISILQNSLKDYSDSQLSKAFYESDIYKTFFSYKESFHAKEKLTRSQWNTLRSVFSQHFHLFFEHINLTGNLNQEQKDICMLLRIGFKEGEIGCLMDIDGQRVNRLKSQANHKLYGDESAKTLKQNLLSHS